MRHARRRIRATPRRAAEPDARIARRLTVDSAGLVAGAAHIASPNRDERPPDTRITLAVVHGISLPPGEFGGDAIVRLFTNRLDASAHPYFAEMAALRVSAHFLIRRDGALIQFVPCVLRAWHAGDSSWRGRERCNDYSIGIELEGTDDVPYTTRQYRTLHRLLAALSHRYPIESVVGHSDVAPGRKSDPGPAFKWARVADRGRRQRRSAMI